MLDGAPKTSYMEELYARSFVDTHLNVDIYNNAPNCHGA